MSGIHKETIVYGNSERTFERFMEEHQAKLREQKIRAGVIDAYTQEGVDTPYPEPEEEDGHILETAQEQVQGILEDVKDNQDAEAFNDFLQRVETLVAYWITTYAIEARDTEYYRSLVVAIGKQVGVDAYTQDDGKLSTDVLCTKVPDIIRRDYRRWRSMQPQLDAIVKVASSSKWLAVAILLMVAVQLGSTVSVISMLF